MTLLPKTAAEAALGSKVARALVPVAAILAVLGLMIVLGIRQNRQRVGANQGRFGGAMQMIGYRCDRAAGALAALQSRGGSWPGGPAVTLRVLHDLKSAGYDDTETFAAGVEHVRSLRRESGLWPAGAGSPTPSMEVTALAWLLLGDELEPTDELRELFEDRQTPLALHRTNGPAAEADLGVNLLLLGVVADLGLGSTGLDAAIRQRLDGKDDVGPGVWPSPGYFALLAAEAGSAPARELLDRFVADPRPENTAGAWNTLDAWSLANHIVLRSDQCLRRAEPCQDLNGVVGALLARGQSDGSWPAAGARDAGDAAGETPGSVEVTSLALRSLAGYRRLLNARAKGLLRSGPPPAVSGLPKAAPREGGPPRRPAASKASADDPWGRVADGNFPEARARTGNALPACS
jgi:hypothetical protein